MLVASLGLTALLSGALGGGGLASRLFNDRINDATFLEEQLARISAENGNSNSGPAPALIRVSVAQQKIVQPQRPLIGRLVEVRKVTVSSEVTGKIVDLPVEEGTAVVGGETVLARVDDTWVRLALAQARAMVASTRAKLAFEDSELVRVEHLLGQSASSQSELEAKRARVDELRAELDEARAVVEEHSEKQLRSVIVAPFDGTVVAKHAELGEHLSPGMPIVEIVSRGEVDARIMVPESVVNHVHLGQELPVSIDPLNLQVSGRVVSVTPYGPAASRTFPVRLRLDDQEGNLKVGMSVTVTVDAGPALDALVVSRDAVLVRPDGSTVWVAVEDPLQEVQVHPVPVSVNVQTKGEYAIEPEDARGQQLLRPGARVVIEGAERLMPGQQVRVVTLEEQLSAVAGP